MTFDFKFGKTPARAGAVKLRFAKYLDKKELKLPRHPSNFGHERLLAKRGWGMFGNDKYGCCVWAGAAHEHRMWSYEGGDHKGAWFRDSDVLSDYAAVTGFDPAKPDTDQGTDMQKAAAYRRDTGVIDGHGRRHKIAAYLALEPGNLEQHLQAMWLFGAVGIGIRVPNCFMDQVDAGKPWAYDSSPGAWAGDNGHYVPLVSKRGDFLNCVTWGAIQQFEIDAWQRTNDESIVYLSDEMLTNGKSPEAFDYQTLQADLNALGKSK